MTVGPGSNHGGKDNTPVNQPTENRSILKVHIPYDEEVHLHQPIMEVHEIKLEPTPLYLQTLPSVGTGETINNWKIKRMGFDSTYSGIVHTPNDNGRIRKVYKFQKQHRDNVVPKFKMEIFMQMKAYNLYNHTNIQVELSNDNAPESNVLNVTVSVPKIYGYGDITYKNSYESDTDYFYIDMEKIHGQTIQEVIDNNYDLCKQLDTIVEKINDNFQQNGIFHNDMNAGNIIIREINIDNNNITKLDVVVIDFGDAVEKLVGRGEGGVNSTLTICNKSNKRKYSAGKRGTRKRMNKNAHKKSKRVRRKTKHSKSSKKVKTRKK
jgi:tRNA A-37 threonylcarbamoyl transferase component Bud32